MRPYIKIRLHSMIWLEFDGFSMQHTINRMAARCNFRMVNTLKLEGDYKYGIHKEDDVEIFIYSEENREGVLLFKGIVTSIAVSLNGSLNVACATALCHLEDCDYYLEDGTAKKTYIKTSVGDIITDIIKPFDIKLVSEYKKHDLKLVKGYNVSYDETAAQPVPRSYAANKRMTVFTIGAEDTAEMAIRKLCSKVGLIPLDDRKGGLMLVDKHHLKTETTIRQGQNLIAHSYSSNLDGLHSIYHVVSKNAVEAGKKRKKKDSYITVDVKNNNVRSYRPKTIMVDALDADECSMVGAARIKQELINSVQFQASIAGWWNAETVLWAPNMVVPCIIPMSEIEGSYTIAGTDFLYSINEGFKTTLDLKPDTVLEYDDPSTYDKTPIEDDDPLSYLNKTGSTRKKGRKRPLNSAEIEAMTIDEIKDSGGYTP